MHATSPESARARRSLALSPDVYPPPSNQSNLQMPPYALLHWLPRSRAKPAIARVHGSAALSERPTARPRTAPTQPITAAHGSSPWTALDLDNTARCEQLSQQRAKNLNNSCTAENRVKSEKDPGQLFRSHDLVNRTSCGGAPSASLLCGVRSMAATNMPWHMPHSVRAIVVGASLCAMRWLWYFSRG